MRDEPNLDSHVTGATVGQVTTLTGGTVDSNGEAAFSWIPAVAGSHSITANYGGATTASTVSVTAAGSTGSALQSLLPGALQGLFGSVSAGK
ncbi:hypothetical protein [Nocardia stercoris]|uniref:Ig-like domain repeat protein n=1 Tax=Nocardia stercoris TaxID=2483361 RepID=A0A3M2KXC8_9NOCA|nr:hypothetical protein [Nocardia stercoris]RMI28165.1 hypothetical protein EBN03_31170 [Nocardia stercoris]